MEVLLLITVVYGIWLFFAYGIFLPNYRFSKRVQIFQLRDELRELKFSKEISTRAYDISENAISNGIQTLHFINVFDVFRLSNSLENDKKAKQKITERIAEIEKQDSERLKTINSKVSLLIAQTSIMNMIGWLPVFVPLAILFTLFRGFARRIINRSNEVALDSKDHLYSDPLCGAAFA